MRKIAEDLTFLYPNYSLKSIIKGKFIKLFNSVDRYLKFTYINNIMDGVIMVHYWMTISACRAGDKIN